jgi:hypothetical protein
MRRRQLKRLWARLKQLSQMNLTREALLMKLGAARQKTPTAWRLVTIDVSPDSATFNYRLDRDKLRVVRRREGRYLLRTNLTEHDPAKLWTYYLQLVAVEEAFKNLKGDLAIRPIVHQIEARIEVPVREHRRNIDARCSTPMNTSRGVSCLPFGGNEWRDPLAFRIHGPAATARPIRTTPAGTP